MPVFVGNENEVRGRMGQFGNWQTVFELLKLDWQVDLDAFALGRKCQKSPEHHQERQPEIERLTNRQGRAFRCGLELTTEDFTALEDHSFRTECEQRLFLKGRRVAKQPEEQRQQAIRKATGLKPWKLKAFELGLGT